MAGMNAFNRRGTKWRNSLFLCHFFTAQKGWLLLSKNVEDSWIRRVTFTRRIIHFERKTTSFFSGMRVERRGAGTSAVAVAKEAVAVAVVSSSRQ